MATIFENLRTERQYRASTGLSKSEFEKLYEKFEKYYEIKKESKDREEKQPVLTDKKEALFFVLYYLKTGVTYQVLGLSFGISDTSAKYYIDRIKPVLKWCLEKLKVMPIGVFSNQKEFEKAFEGVEDIYIDCTEIPVERADDYDTQKQFYSGKKSDTQ